MECSLSQDIQKCIQEAFQLFSGQNTAEEFTLRLLLWQRFYDEGGGRVEPLGRLTKFWLVSQPFLLCYSSTILNWAAQQCAFIEIEEWDQLCGVLLFSTLWLIWTSLLFSQSFKCDPLTISLQSTCIVCLISNQPAPWCEADAANKNPLTAFMYTLLFWPDIKEKLSNKRQTSWFENCYKTLGGGKQRVGGQCSADNLRAF